MMHSERTVRYLQIAIFLGVLVLASLLIILATCPRSTNTIAESRTTLLQATVDSGGDGGNRVCVAERLYGNDPAAAAAALAYLFEAINSEYHIHSEADVAVYTAILLGASNDWAPSNSVVHHVILNIATASLADDRVGQFGSIVRGGTFEGRARTNNRMEVSVQSAARSLLMTATGKDFIYDALEWRKHLCTHSAPTASDPNE